MMSSQFEETTLDSRQVFDGKLLKVRLDRVEGADGKKHVREYIEHPGAVMILVRSSHGSLLNDRDVPDGPPGAPYAWHSL